MSETSELTSNEAVGGQYDENVIRFQQPFTIDRDRLDRAANGLEAAVEVNA